MQQKLLNRSTIVKAITTAVLVLVLLNVRTVLFGGANPVSLQPGTALGASISQAFTSGGSTTLPVIGKDYKLKSARYFDNQQWVVAQITGLTDRVTDGLIVLHMKSGVYTAALGPGSAFPTTSTENLPADVNLYLNGLGVTYEPVY